MAIVADRGLCRKFWPAAAIMLISFCPLRERRACSDYLAYSDPLDANNIKICKTNPIYPGFPAFFILAAWKLALMPLFFITIQMK
jgi:hypothetical protein